MTPQHHGPALWPTPKALTPGSTIAIISPAYPSAPEQLTQAEAFLSAKGFTPKRMPNAANHWRYMAGQDAERLSDFNAALQDPEVHAIWCARGGYGCMRLLPLLDWDLIKQHPKWLIGFSDVTVLQLAAYKHAGLISAYAPMLTSNLIDPEEQPETSWQQLQPLLLGPDALPHVLNAHPEHYTCYHPGETEGILLGGNLSLVTALCGTPHLPDFRGKILFLEDWKESAHSLDRQFEQLRQAGVFDQLTALMLCDFSLISRSPHAPNLTEQALFEDLVGGLDCPVGYGFRIGHCKAMGSLLQGVRAHFNSQTGTLTLLK
ncbi:MAG: LD-carboxypeptidase [Vampirovibrionales bacterium]|nr:LD-carboxypeptidase [Vampirovibrionales bacterium]